MRNALSVDVEDWFQVGAFEKVIARDAWEKLPRRVERNTDRVLELFEQAGVKATFFTLGWVAARHPGLIRRIAEAGHELASHGWDHRRVFTLDETEFRADLERARYAIEDAGGCSCQRLSRAELLDRRPHALGAPGAGRAGLMPIPRASRRSVTIIMAGPNRRACLGARSPAPA